MKLLYIVQLLLVSLVVSLTMAYATGSFTYRFWGLVVVIIPAIFALCETLLLLRSSMMSQTNKTAPVENDEIFDHLFISRQKKKLKKIKRVIYER